MAAAAQLAALAGCSGPEDAAEDAAGNAAENAPGDAAKADAAAKPDAKPAIPISAADAAALRDQITPHWNMPTEPPCRQPIRILIVLAEDGSVVRALAKPEVGYDDPCRAAQDSALRAVWLASPLRVPHKRAWSSVNLVFDPQPQPAP